MKNKYLYFLLLFSVLSACKKDESIDTTYPEISNNTDNAFPVQCSILKRGEKFSFKATFSDNVELGSSSIDIHHNFDHHNHSTEINSCNMEPVKLPVNPFVLIKTFPIGAGQKTYSINEEILIPLAVDPGDYHFLIRLTDTAGWQTIKGISIKII
jgi:hypothetical protein